MQTREHADGIFTDEEWVGRHLLGDQDAFPELVRRHTRSIYNLAYRSTGDVMEAENIVQETFARAYAALPRTYGKSGGRAPFKPWLLTIATNLCRNRARRMRREPAHAAAHVLVDGEAIADTVEQVIDPGPEPLDALLTGEKVAALDRAVAALPLAYRQAIVLRYMEGLTYEEVAAALGLPLNTVRTHLFRAKERLRRHLTRIQEGERDGLPGDEAAAGSVHGGPAEPGRGTDGPRTPRPLLGLPGEGA